MEGRLYLIYVALRIVISATSLGHTCKVIRCGNWDTVCSCRSDCIGQPWAHHTCCDDFGYACHHPPPSLQIGDVNLVVTTDLHSWIHGRTHELYFNASLGDAVSMLEHIKAQAAEFSKDVFFFDNGDINDGTGLSAYAEDHVNYLAPLMRLAPYDALNIGNHELYQRNGRGMVSGEACPIAGLRDSGYIESWKGRYLTSNVVWAIDRRPVGSRFAVLEGKYGTKLLVFGFLYNMPDHCDAVVVEDVATVVKAGWFQLALKSNRGLVDAVVVLAHMDYQDDLIKVIHQSIRGVMDRTLPVQFLAGHSHIRGWERVDDFASSYEAGCKLNTLGFVSFQRQPGVASLAFNVADIDGNTAQFAGAIGLVPASLATPSGRALTEQISSAMEELGLDLVLGCSDRRYRVSSPLNEPDSLWAFYMAKVIPEALLGNTGARPAWLAMSTAALTYDIYPGSFKKGDAFTVSPYGNYWLHKPNISGTVLRLLLQSLMRDSISISRASSSHLQQVPKWVSSGSLHDETLYDLVFCDFDQFKIEETLKHVSEHNYERSTIFRSGSNTSSVLADWFRKRPCRDDIVAV